MALYPATYQVFDVVQVDEFNLTSHSNQPLTLIQRKEVLDKLVTGNTVIKKSIWIDGKGKELHALAVQLDQEGIMAKTKSGLYVPGGRNADWLKIKVPRYRNFVICGYTAGTGWRLDTFGAIVLGVPTLNGYRYVGNSGSGFTSQGVNEMSLLLKNMTSQTSPMLPDTKVPQLIAWCYPKLVVRVKYYDITKDGQLIWPIFQKLIYGDPAVLIPAQVGFDYNPLIEEKIK
jgi:bifunctional non-homologous end joining protein LigD